MNKLVNEKWKWKQGKWEKKRNFSAKGKKRAQSMISRMVVVICETFSPWSGYQKERKDLHFELIDNLI